MHHILLRVQVGVAHQLLCRWQQWQKQYNKGKNESEQVFLPDILDCDCSEWWPGGKKTLAYTEAKACLSLAPSNITKHEICKPAILGLNSSWTAYGRYAVKSVCNSGYCGHCIALLLLLPHVSCGLHWHVYSAYEHTLSISSSCADFDVIAALLDLAKQPADTTVLMVCPWDSARSSHLLVP